WDGSVWQNIVTRLNDFNNPPAETYDISTYANANTKVRFRGTSNATGETAYVTLASVTYDDFATASGATHTPPNIVQAADNYDLAAGASMTVNYQVTVANTIPAGQMNIVNTATVTSVEQLTPLTSSAVIHPIAKNYGHLPDSYTGMNLIADGGASHITSTTIKLGATVPIEPDGINNPTFTEDAAYDNGVTPTGTWRYGPLASGNGGSVTVDVTCPTSSCYLAAWIDWDNDNAFGGDQIIGQTVGNGTGQTINFDIPGGTPGNSINGAFYVRFRLYASAPDADSPNGEALTGGVATIGEVEEYRWGFVNGTPTPVTVAYFRAEQQGGSVDFEWSTVTETGNVGFNLYVQDQDGKLTRINDELIPSHVVDSLERQDYAYSASANGETFYIEDVSVFNETRRHGPFQIGETYGERAEMEKINQAAIGLELQGKSSERQTQLKREMEIPAAAYQTPELEAASGLRSQLEAQPVSSANLQLTSTLNVKVRQTGMYRLTYGMLRNAGLDLDGVPVANITLTNRGRFTPIFIQGQSDANLRDKFGAGAYIEFYGQALDTLYTDTNIYTVQVSATPTPRIPRVSGAPKANPLPASFNETVKVNNQRAFSSSAPGADPWYDTRMFALADTADTTYTHDWSYPFQVTGLANTSTPQTLTLVVWGMTDWPSANPDHHVKVSVNGTAVADETFNGTVEKVIKVTLPAGTLHEGENTLQINVPCDLGVSYDIVNLDKFAVAYPRRYQARNGRLEFTAAGKVFRVLNLPDKNVEVYRIDRKGIVRLTQLKVIPTGKTFAVAFAGTNTPARYIVTSARKLYLPALEATRLTANLNQPAQYLVISHPDFISRLQPLITARQAQGLTVSVVDVNDIYAQYGYGIFTPNAIKSYIAYAKQNLGVEYVLLVGGDTYDYRNFLGINSVSFIPSLYAATGSPYARFAPVDPLYADVNNDNVPDLAIGRFPVRTSAELDLMVNKTLAYAAKDYARTAAFASDKFDGIVSFKDISNGLSAGLPVGWSAENFHLDDVPMATAQSQLIAAMNRGVSLVTYTGHSGPTVWSLGLFDMTKAAALTNYGRPFAAVQWGCWNTYYVDPKNNYLVQSLLFSGDNGAAAVFGAVTVTDSTSEQLLGNALTPRLTATGAPMGKALLEAKQELAQTHPNMLDVLLGWTLMGDPALVVEP
ncbi:MAG: C25 family cysteine peptidase, partial [Anaerolineales bacterium]|nr:C25 family cysteine peptidase [Anaerolineales bacterium]